MIAIIRYNAGNTRSVQNALTRLGFESMITDDWDAILQADKIIFPGVGEAGTAMKYLKERELDKLILSVKQPFLGICLGLQLMCNKTEEGNTQCLGIFDTDVKLFPPTDIVPHMGWNNFETVKGELLKDLGATENTYYVHSYYAELCAETSGVCNYILPFSAVLEKDNFYATQFHPEKSGDVGEKILSNFLAL